MRRLKINSGVAFFLGVDYLKYLAYSIGFDRNYISDLAETARFKMGFSQLCK